MEDTEVPHRSASSLFTTWSKTRASHTPTAQRDARFAMRHMRW
jgi:hypothetical protein